MSYEERLKVWGLTTLAERRITGDLIQMYKSVNGLENINWHTGPQFAFTSNTRAASNNSFRLRRETFPTKDQNSFGHFTSVRHNFFLNRVTEDWNKLTNSLIQAVSLNSFKAGLDSRMLEQAAKA